MKFRTPCVPACSQQLILDPEKPLLMLGSCFTLNIGSRLQNSLWDACVNPSGTLFNPASIARILRLATKQDRMIEVKKNGERFFSWDFPTSFSASSKEELEGKILDSLNLCRRYICCSQALMITFGTAGIYSLADQEDRIVANCHKFPSSKFHRRRMSAEEIARIWISLIADLRELNPALKVILTVSPVRHLKDGFEENSRSKATLILAVENICNAVEECYYFPSYELLTDDLRDYRFYAEDMAHPSEQAADYIFEVFCQSFLTARGKELLKEGAALTKRRSHRMQEGGDKKGYEEFCEITERLGGEFARRHPGMLPL